jgi:hypothetical protein
MDGQHLSKFLRQNELTTDDGQGVSHYVMSGQLGGKLYVSLGLNDEFLEAYGRDLLSGRGMSLVERRSPTFKLHFDVDIKGHLDDADLRRVASLIVDAVAPHYGATGGVVCHSVQRSEPSRRVSSSLHVIFPSVVVDDARAHWVRSSVVARCASELAHLSLDFEDVIDARIFCENGFRMIGSDKVKKCGTCAGRGRGLCVACGRRGFQREDKMYTPWLVVGPSELDESILFGNLAYAAKVCGIRTRLPLSDTRLPLPREAPAKRRRVESSQQVRLPERLRHALERDLRRLHHKYSELILTRVLKCVHSLGVTYILKVGGPGSKFCQNKAGEHASSTIYFVLSKQGLRQRCYCKKSCLRLYGPCDTFASDLKVASPEALELFDGHGLVLNANVDDLCSAVQGRRR